MWPSLIEWRERFPATLLAKLSETPPSAASASSRVLGKEQPTAAGPAAATASAPSSLRATIVQWSAQGYVPRFGASCC
ncbi:hypothetical protein PybrP1_010126 [[Pythium] brassicae (nom. inval.)]|nr:hypothetical protein PybrP1_010126 [[Pythium] brassicae (nom. inval.)]